MRILALVLVGILAAASADAKVATGGEQLPPILVNAREKLDAVADFDPRNPTDLLRANDAFHEVATWAALVDDDGIVRALVDLVEERLDDQPADQRKHLALTEACLSEIYARRLGQPEAARQRFEAACLSAKECSAGLSPQAGAGVSMLYYTYRYGLDLYFLLSREATSNPDRQMYRDRFETLLAEFRALEESLKQMGLDPKPWNEPTLEGQTSVHSGEPVEQTARSEKPKLLHFARPDYPDSLRGQGIEGDVIIKVLIDRDGSVASSQVIQSAHPVLDDLALAAARECRFEPGRQRGIPVKAWMAIPYKFRLNHEEEPDTE